MDFRCFLSGLIVIVFLVHPGRADLSIYCHGKNCYEILELDRQTATPADIRKAYLRLSQQYHPDKLGDSAESSTKFHDVSVAYNVLKDDEIRKEYNEFLDHPERFYMNYATWVKRNYFGHQESLFSAFCLILFTATVADYIYRRSSYNDLRQRLIHNPQVQERIRALRGVSLPQSTDRKASGKRRREYDSDLALTITNDEISSVVQHDDWTGQEPSLANILPIRMLSWPQRIARDIIWALHWFLKFIVLRRPYGKGEKIFLVRYNLGLTEKQWDRLPDHRKEQYLELNLWDLNVYQAWRRKQRTRGSGYQFADNFVE